MHGRGAFPDCGSLEDEAMKMKMDKKEKLKSQKFTQGDEKNNTDQSVTANNRDGKGDLAILRRNRRE